MADSEEPGAEPPVGGEEPKVPDENPGPGDKLPEASWKIPQPILSQHWEPIYILSAVFGAIFFIGLLLVPRGPNAGVIRTCISASAFCMWIFWVTVYIAQMNPVLGPKMENITLAWMSRKWGLPMAADPAAPNKFRAFTDFGPRIL